MRGDKAAAGFQPPVIQPPTSPLTLPRHVAPLSHGRFPSLCSKPDSVNGDLVYGGVLWRSFLSPPLPPSLSHFYTRSQARDLSCERVSIRLASPHRTQSAWKSDELHEYFLLFPFGLSFSFLLHRSIRRASGFRFHLSRAQT